MDTRKWLSFVCLACPLALTLTGCGDKSEGMHPAKPAATAKSPTTAPAGGFASEFAVDKRGLTDAGENPYFILKPGHRLSYRGGRESLIITVLDETKVVDGVKTRVVEERETKGGQLAEVSRNYFAIDPATKDVYYFGEEVDIYKDGKVVAHEGAWQSGKDGAKFGLMMPGRPKVGDRFYQELAPKVAMDRCEIVSLTETLKTPAGQFKDVLLVKDSSALEGGAEKKWYAAGVGLLKDGDLELVEVQRPK
jgi:hypothetical protein